MILMMVINRISHINTALQQARSLLNLLNAMKAKPPPPPPGGSNKENMKVLNMSRTQKELFSMAENLASTLVTARYYVEKSGPGKYTIDPRFLLFEFSHGLILRQSQVSFPILFYPNYKL
jgi:hypothetical protein